MIRLYLFHKFSEIKEYIRQFSGVIEKTYGTY